MLFISKSAISADKAANLANKLILFINVFLYPMVEHKEKSYAYHKTKRVMNKAVRE